MHLIPRPKNVINHEGEFFIERDTEIILSSELSFEDLNLAIMIQEEIEKVLDFKLNINKLFMDKEYSNSIILRECKFENEEEYKIEIKENKAIIEGSGAGFFMDVRALDSL